MKKLKKMKRNEEKKGRIQRFEKDNLCYRLSDLVFVVLISFLIITTFSLLVWSNNNTFYL